MRENIEAGPGLFDGMWDEPASAMPDLSRFESVDSALARLRKSAFRARFRLNAAEKEYVRGKGADLMLQHARDIIGKRLAPAVIPNDGKQTPMRHGSHPVFLAQHATACCCRGCLAKWHNIPAGRALTAEEQEFAARLIAEWIRRQVEE